MKFLIFLRFATQIQGYVYVQVVSQDQLAKIEIALLIAVTMEFVITKLEYVPAIVHILAPHVNGKIVKTIAIIKALAIYTRVFAHAMPYITVHIANL